MAPVWKDFDIQGFPRKVVFVDNDGNELKSEIVPDGSAASAPDVPEVEGYDFIGWDKEFDNVTEDLIVKAQYKIKTFTVTFVDKEDNTIGEAQTVNWNEAAEAPEAPEVEGYTFTGWDKAFDAVTEDLTVKALYEINKYTVTFVDWDETVLKSAEVEHGSAATAPEDPIREGYTFTGWDKAFDNITADLIVTAQYEEIVKPDYTPQNLNVALEDKDGDVEITLSWDKVEGVVSYELKLSIGEKELFSQNTMTLNVISRLLSALEKDYKLTPGTYTIDWAVRSTDAMGQAISEWAAGESFEITVKGPGTGMETITNDELRMSNKVLRDGVIYVQTDDQVYTIQGQKVK